jgi:hypothetical protein
MSRRCWSIEDIVALGATTDLVTAGEILGMGRTKSHQMARSGQFPVPVLRFGNRYVVPVQPILDMLAGKTTTAVD